MTKFSAMAALVVCLGAACAPVMRAQSLAINLAAGTARPPSYVPQSSNTAQLDNSAPSDSAAQPVKGSREFEIWTGGGPGFPINGSVYPVDEWDVGARYGFVLTDLHGPGFLRGRFEYAFDVMPALLVIQPGRIVYGGGFDPFALKWIFKTRRAISPFFELSAGGLFTTAPVPVRSTSFNFTPNAALGLHRVRGKYAWSVDVRWFHISNARIIPYDPGINTLQVRVGLGWFRGPK